MLDRPEWGERMLGEDPAVYARPRVVRLGASLRQGATVLLRGPHGSGMSTVAEQWADAATGPVLRLTSPGTVLPEHDAPSPQVVVLTVPTARRAEAEAIRNVRERWPQAVLLVVSPWGWPDGLDVLGLRPDTVITGRTVAFTAQEVAELAHSRGAPLDANECREVLVATAGQPPFVSGVLRAAERSGHFSEAAVRDGCDVAMSSLATSAFHGLMPWPIWEAGLLTASADGFSAQGLAVLWDLLAEDGAAVLHTLRLGGLILPQGDDLFGFPRGIRGAAARRLTTDIPEDRVVELQRQGCAALIERGHLADALALTARTPSLTTELVAEHWRSVADIPATRVRTWLRGMVHAGTDPRVLLAHVRAIVDATHHGYPGYVTDPDRELAAHLLDRVGDHPPELEAEIGPMLDVISGAMDRANGHHAEALQTHQALAEDLTLDPRDRVVAQLHTGLTAIGVGEGTTAEAVLRGARTGGLAQHDRRLSDLANELHALTVSASSDTAAWWRLMAESGPIQSSTWELPARAWRLSIALSRLDIDMVRRLMDRPWSPVLDDPIGVHLLDMQARVIAHSVLRTPRIALNHLAIIDASSRRDHLSDSQMQQLRSYRTEALLAAGEARRALDMIEEAHGTEPEHYYVEVYRARALMQLGQTDAAVRALTWARDADSARAGRHLVWIHVLLALAHEELGEDRSAHTCLEDALVLGAASGISLPFARQGLEAMTTLLARADELTVDQATRQYLTDLQTARDRLRGTAQTQPLTSQERKVVILLARDDSVRAMAAALHVSPNTIKTQLRNIYRKLGVRNRTEAVRAARSLGFVDDADKATTESGRSQWSAEQPG
ncbi:LuxR family transcriptional regulator [Ruania alba]|uniref:ATP-, maltotriose-and DNA-dependent transcriptional regulator MalT n=1 Tax=Ruania alba TaxID=648782 RepID=A0A1H5M505_9MICO|nr:LuxR family transcriptional regulator [Ruania alba]SEE84402.1 ATP-, maltotriose-and DNA-dependent transcriptional regulator MalT [Ruania alba]